MTRFIFICSALLVVFAGAALGAANYQRTKDGKSIVWNDAPQPGDTAEWFGNRDKENYAAGVGILIWYNGDGAVYARYHGNMVHGKFRGAVNVHSKGKTGHATFADGKRMSRWLAGPAPSRAEPDWRSGLATGRVRVAAATGPAARLTAKASAKKASNAEPAAITARVPQPESSTPAAEPKADKAPPENPMTEKQDIPAEGPSAEKKSATANTPIGSEITTTSSVGEKNDTQPPSNASADRTNESKPEIDDLLAPPSTLRIDPIVETPSTAEAQTATTPGANAQLTQEEAVNLADTEARVQGYDLNQYERPKADYSKVKGKWSLIYDLKQADAAGATAPYFRVSVDDETRKVEVKQ
jgi:hypothetical protein